MLLKPNLTAVLFISQLPGKKWITVIRFLLIPFLGLFQLIVHTGYSGCLSYNFGMDARLYFNIIECGSNTMRNSMLKNPSSMIN